MSNAEAVPSFKDFDEWSVKIAECWYALGTKLGVPDDHLTNIDINTQLYPTHERRAFQMLKTWREQGGASYRKMAGALRELGKVELANSICPSMDDSELCGQAQGHHAASTSQPTKSLQDPLVKEPECIPSDTDLLDVSCRIISCWYFIGIRLGVDRRTLQNINRNNEEFPSPQKKALEMLFIWRDKGSSSSSVALQEAVRQQLGPDDSDEDDDELCGQAQGLHSTHLASETRAQAAKRRKTRLPSTSATSQTPETKRRRMESSSTSATSQTPETKRRTESSSTSATAQTPEANGRKTEEKDSGHQAASTSQPTKSLQDPLVEELESILKREYKTREHTYVTPFPWLEDWQLSLKTIFIKVRMTGRDTERSHQLKGDIRDMYEIFQPHEHCEEPRVVLVEGAPGIGKTVFCQKVAADWSEGQTGEAFPSFRILLKLKCRDIINSTTDTVNVETLKDSIVDQLLPDAPEELKTALFDYIKTTQSEVLLVLDGLDELKQTIDLSSLIKKELRPWQCKFLLTSRNDPQLRKNCDSLFQIVGFKIRDAKSYITKFFGENGKEKAKYLIERIGDKSRENSKLLRDLVSNPLTTSLLCFVCDETDGKLPSSKIQLYQELTRCVLTRYYKKQDREPPVDPVATHEEDLAALGRLALKGIANDQLHFYEDDFHAEGRATKVLDFGFLSKETSASRIRPRCSYQFVHKTVQEYFAAVSLCQQLLSGNYNCLSYLCQNSPASRRKYTQVLLFIVGLLSQKAEAGKQVFLRLVSSLKQPVFSSISKVSRSYTLNLVQECADVNAEFGEAMCEAVFSSNTWEKLDLSRSNISETDVEYRIVCRMLRENRPLKTLYLNRNNIKDVTTLAESMVSNHTLQSLSLQFNPFLTGLPALARALTHNTTLQGLGLGEKFRDEPAIQELEKQNTRLYIC